MVGESLESSQLSNNQSGSLLAECSLARSYLTHVCSRHLARRRCTAYFEKFYTRVEMSTLARIPGRMRVLAFVFKPCCYGYFEFFEFTSKWFASFRPFLEEHGRTTVIVAGSIFRPTVPFRI